MTNKENFLAEHNKLCSNDLQATMNLLLRFEVEKPDVCRKGNWSVDKVRRPFVIWLTSLNPKLIKTINRGNA